MPGNAGALTSSGSDRNGTRVTDPRVACHEQQLRLAAFGFRLSIHGAEDPRLEHRARRRLHVDKHQAHAARPHVHDMRQSLEALLRKGDLHVHALLFLQRGGGLQVTSSKAQFRHTSGDVSRRVLRYHLGIGAERKPETPPVLEITILVHGDSLPPWRIALNGVQTMRVPS